MPRPSRSGLSFFTAHDPAAEAAEQAATAQRRRRRRVGAGTLAALVGAGMLATVSAASPASADPSANAWYRLRMCESSNNYRINTGNGYYGAYQFDLSTWRSVGGRGYPNQATPAEQDARALILYRERGWQPWTCAGIVGLREDGDARSGRTGDIHVGSGSSSAGSSTRPAAPRPSSGVPAWPNTQYWNVGTHSAAIAQWQRQLHARGSHVNTNGDFGVTMLRVVRSIQKQNGLPVTGLLGPVTWKLAWTGKYAGSHPVGSGGGARSTSHPGAAPAWPNTQYWSIGDHSTTIARWQTQMHHRGSAIVGTGDFGPNTLAVVKRLQRMNGLPSTGLLGPVTWRLAWTGKY